MKTARELFLTVGVPITWWRKDTKHQCYPNFRAFNEQDIAEIQRDALEHALAIVDKYQSSMGTMDGMKVANCIWKEIKELKELSK